MKNLSNPINKDAPGQTLSDDVLNTHKSIEELFALGVMEESFSEGDSGYYATYTSASQTYYEPFISASSPAGQYEKAEVKFTIPANEAEKAPDVGSALGGALK